MRINSNQYKPNFKAVKIAHTQNNIKGITTNIDIFKISRDDNIFLENLRQISIKSLCPTLRENLQERWQKILDYCARVSKLSGNTSYVALANNRPCSIITTAIVPSTNELVLDGICSIPNKDGKKLNMAGKTLFYQMFLDAKKNHVEAIELEAITDGPFDTVKKYQELGFVVDATEENYTDMSCDKSNIERQLKNLAQQIKYVPTDEEHISLNNIIH